MELIKKNINVLTMQYPASRQGSGRYNIMRELRKATALFLCFVMFMLNIAATATENEEETDMNSFDFAAIEAETHLSDTAVEVTNAAGEKIEVFGNASATDYINPPESVYNDSNGNKSSEGGIWWNGKPSDNNRYFSFTPTKSGIIKLRLRNTYNKNSGTAAKLSYGTANGTAISSTGSLNSSEYQETSGSNWELEAGTTYYFWPTSGGVNISAIIYTPDETEEEPTPTATTELEPTPTATAELEPTPTAMADAEPTPTATTDTEPTLTMDIEPSPTTEITVSIPETNPFSFGSDAIHLSDTAVELSNDAGTIKIYGNSSANDWINPAESVYHNNKYTDGGDGGIHWNGKTDSGNRYFEFTPVADGTMALKARESYYGTSSKLNNGTLNNGTAIKSYALDSEYADYVTETLTAGTTYYFWPSSSGADISEIIFYAGSAPEATPVLTIDPIPTAEPAEKPLVSPPTTAPETKVISSVDTSYENSDRIMLTVDNEPFFYNGIQMRIDKVTDTYGYNAEERENLFKTAAEAGFTVVNCQIRWTDIQPEIKIKASESAYIKGGANSETHFDGTASITSSYSENEDEQCISYIKFDLSELDDTYYDGTKLRIYVNSISGTNSLRIYGITSNSWNADDVTWCTAPNHDGYAAAGEGIYDCGTTPEWDPVSSKHYYDFDVTDFINSYCLDSKTASFMLKTDYATAKTLSIDGAAAQRAPQLILSRADVYDWSWLDEAIDDAEKYGLKFEVLWFGMETCSISMDGRVPYYVHRNYQKSMKADGTPFFKKASESDVYGIYYYLMCKNDLSLRKKEGTVLQTMFNHIAEKCADTHTVIGCQVANEPAVGRLHGSYVTDHCYCDTCVAKKGDMSTQDFRDLTMWEYCNSLSTYVKTSGYSVWTRVNNFGSTDASGVAYNEQMRETVGTNLDFIGHDPYRESVETLYKMGHTSTKVGNITINYAAGKNLPMIMENSGEVSNAESLLMAALAGGSFYNVYDICSTDGHGLYDNKTDDDGNNYIVPHGDYVDGVINANKMLKSLAPIISTYQPDGAGGERLVYFNERSSDDEAFEKRLKAAQITYKTDNGSVGIAVLTDDDTSIILASNGASSFSIANVDDVLSVKVGAYEDGVWTDAADKLYKIENGCCNITMEAYECVKVTIDGEVGELKRQRFEFETLDYVTNGATASIISESGYSGDAWSCATYSADGGYVEYTFEVDEDGEYDIVLGTKDKNNRVTAQMFIDGVGIGDDLVMDAAKDTANTYNMGSMYLAAGEHTVRLTATDRSRGNYGGYDYMEITETVTIMYDYNYDLSITRDTNGLMTVYVDYHGTEATPSDALIIAEYGENGALANIGSYELHGSGYADLGEYTAAEDSMVKLFVWNSLSEMEPQSRVYTDEDIREISAPEENLLEGKTVYAFGDSIVYGHNAPDNAFMDLIEDEYGIVLTKKAKNGATVIQGSNDIITQVNGAPEEEPDFVVFDGYTNDAYESVTSKYGTAQGANATEFDNTTFCGAFEEIIYTMKQKWPNAKIVFITIHKSGARDFEIQGELVDLTLKMCAEWGVDVVDMFNDCSLDTRNADEMAKYIIGGSGSHPNVLCCQEFYIPMIHSKLNGLCKNTNNT